jgi:parvulin-like peptidyl-prolyl isomerase
MKRIFFAIFLLASVQLEAQPTVREQFEKINTVADAEKYVTANASLKPAILRLSYGKDTAIIDKRLLKQNKGDIFSVGFVTYKVVDVKESNAYRASYIFLDRGTLNNREVDSLSKVIVAKLNAGESFESLSDKYTMDGNDTKGDLGWFYGEGQVPKEVQEAVAKHKKGDIFFLDIPERQWYYILKKTYDDDFKKEIVVLRANGR